jgi:hypothetical protein
VVVRGGTPVLTVGKDSADVERRLMEGQLACPVCAGRLAGWGHARPRVIRGEGGIGWRLRPRRARCAGCGCTHVLLPVSVLVRRADAATVIGAALALAAAGLGHRLIAQRLGRPVATVRGWLRRFASRAGPLRAAFTALVGALDPDPRLPAPGGSGLADAVAAIVAAAGAVARRWGQVVSALSPWELASAVSLGGLLGPGTAVELINTSRLW